MIDFLRGQIVHRDSDHIVVDVQGVGYRVFCANPFAIGGSDNPATVYIHHHVREDAIFLFGFGSREEQTLFRRLIDVSGIGPKVAIGILSAGRPADIIGAIQHENLGFLKKLPGIGLKTAQRMILDLKDKLTGIAASSGEGTQSDAPVSAAAGGMLGMGSVWPEAKLALMALGYTDGELDRIWPSVKGRLKETDTVDAVVKLALQLLFKG